MGLFNRNRKTSSTNLSEDSLENYGTHNPNPLRIFTSVCYTLSLVFLILVCIGNINNKPVIRDTFFLTMDLSNVIPESVPNAVFINSIARTIGLHDFYQVGLWNFCEGYNGEGITHCSPTTTLYWFDPVKILLNELLAGATLSLPTEVTNVLKIVRIASWWMFVSFIIGTCLTFLCIFFAPMAFSHQPRWTHKRRRIFLRSLPITILTFLAALFTVGASAIATVMFVIFQRVFASTQEVNIDAKLGVPMLAFMWIGSGFNLLGWFAQLGVCCGICCCQGRGRALKKRKQAGNTMTEKTSSNGDAKQRSGFRSNR